MSPSAIDLETRVAETLRTKSAQIPEVVTPFDPDLIVMTPEPRSSRRRVLVRAAAAGVLVIATAVGLSVVLGDGGGDDGPPVGVAPAGTPAGVVSIEALPTLTFQAREFTTNPGLNEIDFSSQGGTHALEFADPSLGDFRLGASDHQVNTGWVTLEAGRDYTIFCAIPGHRAAGMQAVIHVRTRAPEPTKGTIPPTMPTRPDGTVDVAQLPDYIAVAGDGRPRGYVKREDLYGPNVISVPPVYGEDLRTVIGHMYPGRGFVPLGQDPARVPLTSTTTVVSTTTVP